MISDINVCDNTGGGNCFYKSLSQFYYKNEKYHIYFRKIIAELIKSKKHEDCLKFQFIYKNEKDILIYLEYFEELISIGNYPGQYEIINATIKLNCNIIIHRNKNIIMKVEFD